MRPTCAQCRCDYYVAGNGLASKDELDNDDDVGADVDVGGNAKAASGTGKGNASVRKTTPNTPLTADSCRTVRGLRLKRAPPCKRARLYAPPPPPRNNTNDFAGINWGERDAEQVVVACVVAVVAVAIVQRARSTRCTITLSAVQLK